MAIIMYGTATCVDCLRSKQFFEKHSINFEYIGLEDHPEFIEKVENLNNGLKITPTIIFDDGSILAEPNNQQLAEKLDIKI
jgi:glutaredoxin